MTDQLEELLLRQEPEGDEPVWWQDGRVRPVPRWQEEQARTDPERCREEPGSEMAVREQSTARGRTQRRGHTEEALRKQAGMWTARELERTRRAARRAAQESAERGTMHRNGQKAERLTGGSAFAALKDSPATGRQGLTAQIDMQFRRDARRYDGRLGLL